MTAAELAYAISYVVQAILASAWVVVAVLILRRTWRGL